MRRLLLPTCVLLLALPTASRTAPPAGPPTPAAPLRVTVFPATQKAASGYQWAITMRVTNVSSVPQTVTVMSCSWEDNWTVQATRPAEHARLGLGGETACAANAPRPQTLPPGGFLEKQTVLWALPDYKQKARAVHYRIGFTTQPGTFYNLPGAVKAPVYWSQEAVITAAP